jgi:hypothetical protein
MDVFVRSFQRTLTQMLADTDQHPLARAAVRTAPPLPSCPSLTHSPFTHSPFTPSHLFPLFAFYFLARVLIG